MPSRSKFWSLCSFSIGQFPGSTLDWKRQVFRNHRGGWLVGRGHRKFSFFSLLTSLQRNSSQKINKALFSSDSQDRPPSPCPVKSTLEKHDGKLHKIWVSPLLDVSLFGNQPRVRWPFHKFWPGFLVWNNGNQLWAFYLRPKEMYWRTIRGSWKLWKVAGAWSEARENSRASTGSQLH